MGFNSINAGGVDEVQDISDQPLPPLYEPSSVTDTAPVSQVPGVGTPEQVTDPSPDLPVVDDAVEATRSRNRRSAAERIAQLTRRYREEQEQRSYAEKVLEEQSRQIAALRQQISSIGPMLQQPVAAAPQPQPTAMTATATANDLLAATTAPDPTQPPTQPTPALPTALSPDSIRSVLREVIQEQTLQQQKQIEEQRRLMAAHEEAFAMAVEDFPELAQANSRERALFNELYDKSPIKHLPDAPIQIAFQVKGILADQRGARDVDQAKRQMAGIVPTPTGAAELGESQIASAKKRLAELQERMRRGDNSFDTYKEMRVLRSQLNAARRR